MSENLKCPKCAHVVDDTLRKCEHCGEVFCVAPNPRIHELEEALAGRGNAGILTANILLNWRRADIDPFARHLLGDDIKMTALTAEVERLQDACTVLRQQNKLLEASYEAWKTQALEHLEELVRIREDCTALKELADQSLAELVAEIERVQAELSSLRKGLCVRGHLNGTIHLWSLVITTICEQPGNLVAENAAEELSVLAEQEWHPASEDPFDTLPPGTPILWWPNEARPTHWRRIVPPNVSGEGSNPAAEKKV